MPSSRLLTAFNHNHHDFTFILVLIYSRFLFCSGLEKLYKETNTNMSEEETELLARIGQLAGSCPPSIDFTRNFGSRYSRSDQPPQEPASRSTVAAIPPPGASPE
jgi:hypothetical protein